MDIARDGKSEKSHIATAFAAWSDLQKHVAGEKIEITGAKLNIAAVVATSYYNCTAVLTKNRQVLDKITASVNVLMHYLTNGNNVYGVNTGFGGSADSRTDQLVPLQAALLQLTQAGILVDVDKQSETRGSFGSCGPHSMPASWVRGTMMVRANQSTRGHSAVTIPVIESVLKLLETGITPVVPLRGSVSASGDLMPLAYVAGAIQGSPDIYVQVPDDANRSVLKTTTAMEALQAAGIENVKFGPKEGLGLVNGTAASTALASLVMYETHQLAVLTQVLGTMAVEALQGTSESFHPFISEVRPHDGQIETARNMLAFLQGSSLAKGPTNPKRKNEEGMEQDRYATRSAPQWIGPQLEDLLLADKQITIELNSTADNPLVNVETRNVHCGANFQAASITSAMEKTRLSLQMMGKILFAQFTEMVNPDLSNGLPTNLVADDPNCSFTMKGVDISMAAYMAELGYLANPVSSHVQSAEMQNQSINSMALVSARYSMQAAEVVSMMTAAFIYAACQALDLRAMHLAFLGTLPDVINITMSEFTALVSTKEIDTLARAIENKMAATWWKTSKLEASARCEILVESTLPLIFQAILDSKRAPNTRSVDALSVIKEWKTQTVACLVEAYDANKTTFVAHQHTEQLLGAGSKIIYRAVRHDLQVPFHQGFIEHPTVESATLNGRPKKSVGSWISVIYQALRNGDLHKPLMKWVSENRSILE